MTANARLKVRLRLAGWKKVSFRTVRVAYTASKLGLAMMAPAHAQPHCIATSFTVDCKATSTEAPRSAVWLP